jgi:hypothetical protein
MQPTPSPTRTYTFQLSARWLQVIGAVIIALLLLSLRGCPHSVPTAELNALRLSQALRDSTRSVVENGQLRREKLTLQGTIHDLQIEAAALNAQQLRLLATVKTYQAHPKGPALIAAGSIKGKAALVKPQPAIAPELASADSSALHFGFKSDSLNYRVRLTGVRALPGVTPELQLESLSLPNEATVAFTWDDAHAGHPVSFSVTNSNPLFRVGGVESYAIPELRPGVVQPHGWPKFWQKIGHGIKAVVPVAIGALAGFAAGALIVH